MRARGWATLAGVAVLGAVAALVVPWPSERPVALGSLAAGRCFVLPSAHYLREHPDAFDRAPRLVKPVSCQEPHLGEVVAQAAVDPGRLPYGDLVAASSAACREPFADYNPDFWALPANVGISFAPPREQDLKDRPTVTCYYSGESFMLTAALRGDPSRLSAEQRRYLDAVRTYNTTSADALDTVASTPGSGVRAWAKEMADAEQRTVDALQQIGAPRGAEKPFAELIEQHRKAVDAWQTAASDPSRTRERIAAARDAEHAGLDAARAVRAALGLATTVRPKGYSL